MKSTPHGANICNKLERFSENYSITTRGAPNTAWYEGKTRTIHIDPNFSPVVQTESGPMPADLTTILGREVGHAATKVWDDGPGNMNNVIKNENGIRQQLSLPIRTSYP